MAGKYLEQQLEFYSMDVTSYCMDEVLRAFDDLPYAQPEELHLNQKQQLTKRPKEVTISQKQLQQIQRQNQIKTIKKTTKTKPRNVKRKRNPCSICHVERHGVRRRRLPCGHVFHKTCFWTQLSINCPLCPKNDDDSDNEEEYVQEYK